MSRQSRRQFIKTSAAASAVFSTFTIAGTKSSGRVIGAGDTINVAVAGVGNRGRGHVSGYNDIEKTNVTWLVDPDMKRLIKGRTRGARNAKTAQDIRKALEDKNLDAVSIASCNHWHSLIAFWSCQAGKDVYVEKPMSHNIHEGRAVVEAAKKYGRVVQHGTQGRCSRNNAQIKAAIKSGKYGEVVLCHAQGSEGRRSIKHKKLHNPPPHIDFNVWLGPAPEQPYHGNLCHYNWHWFWDFGNGDIGNQGVHNMDAARWGMPGATLPDRVWSLGGRFKWNDQGQTPNTQMAVYEFGKMLLIFEVINLKQPKNGNVYGYYTTEGVIRGGTFFPHKGQPVQLELDENINVTEGGPFVAFIKAVRSRKPEDNYAPPLEAHYSASLCHLANISYRLGEETSLSKKNKAIGEVKHVVETFEKIKEVVRLADLKLEETKYRMGRVLRFDPKTEKFIGDEQADRLLTRQYRKPFVVPDSV